MKRVLCLALVLAGCGLGVHRNPTVSITAPYHEHQKTIASFPEVAPGGRPVSLPNVGVGAFIRYYPTPIGFAIGTAQGPRKSWGNADLVSWSEYTPNVLPEQALQNAFAQQLAAPLPDAQLVVTGAITDVSWYVLDSSTSGGRITSRLAVVRRDGTPVFEGELSSTGRTRDLQTLITVHVERWLTNDKLLAALRAGGTP